MALDRSIRDHPPVTVIIPARNEAGFIAAAVSSVIEQSYEGSVECLVVNNGSTDETVAVAREIQTTWNRMVRVENEPATGIARAKNRGAATALGCIFVFMDGDSTMSAELVAEVANQHKAGYPAGSLRVVSAGGGWIDRAFFELMEFGKVRMGVRAQMLYCDRRLFEELGGFDPTLRLGEDVDFLKRAARQLRAQGVPVVHVQTAEIATSPRRLSRHGHLGTLEMFARWALAFAGFGRSRPY